MTKAARFPLRLIAAAMSLAFLWAIFSLLAVPAIIKSAYRGGSLPFLNDMISGQAIHSVEHYLVTWENISWRILGLLVVLGLIPLPLVTNRADLQFYSEAGFGTALAVIPRVTNIALSLLGLVVVPYLYFYDPVGYVYFVAEDHWAEYGTFVSSGMAFFFLAWVLFKDRSFRKPGFVLLALGAFLLAMEEISWGQRILGLGSPSFFAKYNVMGEIGFHNLGPVHGGYLHMVAGIVIFVWSIVLPVVTKKSSRVLGWCNRLGIPIVPFRMWPLFLLAVFYLTYAPLIGGEEVGELFLGIAIALLSLNWVLAARQGTVGRRAAVGLARASTVLTLGMLTTFLVLFYTDIEALKSHLNWFAATALPGEGMYRQAEMVFDYMNDHPELLTPETRLQHGALLMQMGKQPKAKEVLELALAEQGGIKKDRPENTTAYRVAGQALTLLGRRGEAQVEFRHALEMDRARLERLTGTEAEAKIRWSLGRTLLAGGEDAAALEQLSIAGAVARDRRTKKQIKEYIEENFGKDALVP